MATASSLQHFLDSAELPTLVLDFRLLQSLDEPANATISNIVVSKNFACNDEKFKHSAEKLLSQQPDNERWNPKLKCRDRVIGAHMERHVIDEDI